MSNLEWIAAVGFVAVCYILYRIETLVRAIKSQGESQAYEPTKIRELLSVQCDSLDVIKINTDGLNK